VIVTFIEFSTLSYLALGLRVSQGDSIFGDQIFNNWINHASSPLVEWLAQLCNLVNGRRGQKL
jgi:hypothetical protein